MERVVEKGMLGARGAIGARGATRASGRSRPLLAKVLALAVCWWIAAAAGPLASAQSADGDERSAAERPTIVVTGMGDVQAAPNVAEINVGVVTEAASASQALSANNRAMEQLFGVLQQQGIAEKDRQTTNFNVSPQYRHDDGRRPLPADAPGEPQIVGYQVSNSVHIKVRKIAELGKVLDAVVGAGSNQIHGIQFSIDQQNALKDDARKKAMAQAWRKAELLARAAGAQVGPVVKIEEYERSDPGPQPRMMMMEAAGSVPIAAGEQTVEAHVRVTYQLKVNAGG